MAFAFGAQRSADQSFERTLRLFGPIVPEAIAYNVTPFKMELSLVKANATSSWGALEAPPEEPLGGPRGPTDDGPMPYPSSARTKCNWDESSPHAREELQQAADGSESVDAFFKKLYGDADDDTRRAMMKSFVSAPALPFCVPRASEPRSLLLIWRALPVGRVVWHCAQHKLARSWRGQGGERPPKGHVSGAVRQVMRHAGR